MTQPPPAPVQPGAVGSLTLDGTLAKRAADAATAVVPATPGSAGQPTRFATPVPKGATINHTQAVTLDTATGTATPTKAPEIPKGLPWGKPEVVAQAKEPGGNTIKMTYVAGMGGPATVTKVGDGDGVTGRFADGKDITCRLDQTNAPEVAHNAYTLPDGKKMNASPDQSFGREAQKHLENLILNKEVTIKVTKTKGSRNFCEVEFQGKNVELNQLEAGMAWVYDRYVNDANKSTFKAAEAKAKAQRKGLWSELNPINPETFARQFN